MFLEDQLIDCYERILSHRHILPLWREVGKNMNHMAHQDWRFLEPVEGLLDLDLEV